MAAPRQVHSGPVPRIFERLLAERRLPQAQYDAAVMEWRLNGGAPDEILLDVTRLPEAELLKLLAGIYRTRFVSTEKLARASIDRSVLELVPRKVVERHEIMPIVFETGTSTLSIVTADPENVQVLEEVRLVTRLRSVVALLARTAAVRALIAKVFYGDPAGFLALERRKDDVVWPGMVDVFERKMAADPRAASRSPVTQPIPDLPPGLRPDPPGKPQPAPPVAMSMPAPPMAAPAVAKPAGSRIPSLPPPPPSAPPQTNRTPVPAAPVGMPMTSWLESLNVLVSLIENNRSDLRGHSAHVARLTRKLCERLSLAEKDADEIVAAAYLHDLGKTSSFHLTAFNVAEYEGHRIAAQKSYLTPGRLMDGVKLPDGSIRTLNHMYERVDGKGFPDGLSGKDIPIGARIIALTDTYADLTQNPRNPFRKQLRPVEACDVLGKYRGTVFDHNLVDIHRDVISGDDLKAKLLSNRRSALIVDSDPEETTVLELRMIEQGFEVKIARTSDQALMMMQSGEFELVVSEVDLQPSDGFALLEQARSVESVRNIPWVFLSGRADREAINRGFELGAVDFVEKPVKAEILVAKLRKLLESERRGTRAASGVSGSLQEMGLPEIIQILSQGRKTGNLTVRSGNDSGEIHFVTGEVWNALYGKLRAADAVYAMLKLRTGEFSVDPNFKAPERVIMMSAEGLLLEGMRRMDEEGR